MSDTKVTITPYIIGQTRTDFVVPGGVPVTTAYTNFIARTSGLNQAHLDAYKKLFYDLTTAGLFNSDGTTNFFDFLYVLATADATTANLNLVGSSFTAVPNGSPTFTADNGYTGVDASTTVWLETGFNPRTASSPKFVQNNAHISCWSNTNAASGVAGGTLIGMDATTGGNTYRSNIFPKFNDGNSYFRINDTVPSSAGAARSDSRGHFVAARNGASSQFGYFSATDQSITPVASNAYSVLSTGFAVLALENDSNVVTTGGGYQCMSASAGAYLSATNVTDFYNALHTYLVTIAGIGY